MADEAVPTPRLMLKKEYAAHRKVSPPMVSHWIKQGRIALRDGKVDVEASDALLAASLDPARGGAGGHNVIRDGRPGRPPAIADPEPMTEIVAANVDDKQASAALKKLRLRKEAGELVDGAQFIAATERAFAVVREGLAGMPARLGATIANRIGADTREVVRIIEDEAIAISGELGRRLKKMAEDIAA